MDQAIAASPTALQRVFFCELALCLLLLSSAFRPGHSLGSIAPIAVVSDQNSENTVCAIMPGARQSIRCWRSGGSEASSIPGGDEAYAGLAGGKGFFCGLRQSSGRPFCWASGSAAFHTRRLSRQGYAQIAVGESHICGIRADSALVDCWRSRAQALPPPRVAFSHITAGANFTCGITALGARVLCWGSVASIQSGIPGNSRARALQAGEQHVCALVGHGRRPFCWGDNRAGQIQLPPRSSFSSFALGSAHTCGLLESSQAAVCWGDNAFGQLNVPQGVSFTAIAAADHYTCGISASNLSVICWGQGFSAAAQSLPVKSLPALCSASPCGAASYPFQGPAMAAVCASASQQACVACTIGCPEGFYESAKCGLQGDRQCSPRPRPPPLTPPGNHHRRRTFLILAMVVGSVGVFVGVASVILWVWICCSGCLGKCKIHHSEQTETQVSSSAIAAAASRHRESRSRSMGRANAFSFDELDMATDGFSSENKIANGSFGAVYSGVLASGQRVAIKRAENLPNAKKYEENEIAFENELQSLTRLHHKHLVSLVGFCDDDDEMLLVYDYMPNGTLFDHLHGFDDRPLPLPSPSHSPASSPSPSPLRSWPMRMKLALEAAKGIEYLHVYAKPPIIHRDIKSQNILIDATWAARVSDFGLSLMAPAEEDSHLSIAAAGTFGYVDPQYYSLQQLTAKSDVYSFGVVLLELITGKRAAFKSVYGLENLVEFAVPRIVAGEIQTILDPNAEHPQPQEMRAISLLAEVSEQCVRYEGKERPSISEVVTSLETVTSIASDNQKLKARLISAGSNTP